MPPQGKTGCSPVVAQLQLDDVHSAGHYGVASSSRCILRCSLVVMPLISVDMPVMYATQVVVP